MNRRLALVIVVLGAFGAVLLARSLQSVPEISPKAGAGLVPELSPPTPSPQVVSVGAREFVQRPAEQRPQVSDVVARSAEDVVSDGGAVSLDNWKRKWAAVKSDEGESLGVNRNEFRKALRSSMRSELFKCVKDLPRRKEIPPFYVEMFVESTPQGYVVRHAEVPADANLDTYASRCIELAFEKNLAIADGGVEPDQLLRITYPIVLNPAPEPSPVVEESRP